MTHEIFSIFDEKASAYLTPFFFHKTDMAIRQFTNMINDPACYLSLNPADYTLFTMGTWDDNKNSFKTIAPATLGNGVEFIKPNSPDEPNGT